MKTNTDQAKIGSFIKSLREQRGLTQGEFAKSLATSQSAVARMEKGAQNLTLEQIAKISDVLEHKIVAISDSVDFKIEGGQKLSGTIRTNCSKNGAVGLIAAALINKDTTTLKGIPYIEEVHRMMEALQSIGVKIKWSGMNTLEITPPKKYNFKNIDEAAFRKIRVGLYLFGALGKQLDGFSLPHSGGCKMGKRTISAHEGALTALGLKIKTTDTHYQVSHGKLHGADITMLEAGDTSTINALLLAAQIPEKTILRFAPPNYQVQEVCFFLQKLGVQIEGIGTTTLTVKGRDKFNKAISYENSEDPIESMMFISAAIVTHSKLTITRCPIDFLRLEMEKLKGMGQKFTVSKVYTAKNGFTKLVDITVLPSKLKALADKIHPLPYPGINADNLPFFVPIATVAEGTTLVHDWMWENRAIYFTELNRLGANVHLADPHRAFIEGPTKLTGAQVVCPPALRPAMIILIAMLGASGTSTLRNVYSIRRGYEEIADRLNSIGAKITVITGV
ncbi:MAG TPA: UDP-N-acetylglucosamine 1-carboxyvinyltransferase [Patescibacteria group bacterium]|jgi:UDP-N-acetylglucosamine 1-carboxyvinyltransferase|nr:UDP-N-acetylglucosamine 1-carboxyvinyltransferase [Patescibacteria group bacterium]